MRARFAILLLPFLAAACGNAFDRAQLDLCRRVLPALHPDGASLREIRVGSGPSRIRIDYAAREPGQESRQEPRVHVTVCGFDPAERLDLVAVETDGRTLGEARLLYLKRYWLGPLGGANEAEIPGPVLPEISVAVAYAAQQLVNALVLVAIYGLLATAYSLIYGLAGRINLAFGEMAVLGAYGAISGIALTRGIGHPVAALAAALAVAALLASLWSYLAGRAVIAPLHRRYRHGQPILIATAALAVAIQEFLRLSQGARERITAPFFNDPISLARAGRFVVTVTPMQLAIAGLALAAALVTLWLFFRTRFGRQWRACADDPLTAALFGVAPDRVLAATFILAGLNAGIAGWIIAVYYGSVSFSMGTMLGLKALLAAILGGIGRVEGAFLGGVLIGLIEAVWSAYFDTASRDLVLFSLLAVIFIWRPGGLLGLADPSPRQV